MLLLERTVVRNSVSLPGCRKDEIDPAIHGSSIASKRSVARERIPPCGENSACGRVHPAGSAVKAAAMYADQPGYTLTSSTRTNGTRQLIP